MTAPRVLRNLSESQYNALPGVRASWLKTLCKSTAADLHHEMSTDDGGNSSTRMGRALHVITTEGRPFTEAVAVWESKHPDGRNRPRNGKEWDEFQEKFKDKVILRDDEVKVVRGMSSSIARNTAATRLLKSPRENRELVLQWREGCVLCKARIDVLNGNKVVDLKSAASTLPQRFSKQAYDDRYITQAVHYLHGVKACGLCDDPVFAWVAVENSAPYKTLVKFMDERLFSFAEDEWQWALDYYSRCERHNQWPGNRQEKEEDFLLRYEDLPVWGQRALFEVPERTY